MGHSNRKRPKVSVVVPFSLSMQYMCTPLTGSPEWAITFPTMTVWASSDMEMNMKKIATNLPIYTRCEFEILQM